MAGRIELIFEGKAEMEEMVVTEHADTFRVETGLSELFYSGDMLRKDGGRIELATADAFHPVNPISADVREHAQRIFDEMLNRKKVVIVGNAPVFPNTQAAREEYIANADTVFRFNHCRGLGHGNGGKVSAIVLSPAGLWFKHKDLPTSITEARKQKAVAFFTGAYDPDLTSNPRGSAMRQNILRKAANVFGPQIEFLPLPEKLDVDFVPRDTGTHFLRAAQQAATERNAKPAEVVVCGMSFGRDFLNYVTKEGPHYMRAKNYRVAEESAERTAAVSALEALVL